MHNIHISTGFMFVVVLFILGMVGIVLWYRSNKRSQENEANRLAAQDRYYAQMAEYRKTVKSTPAGTSVPVPQPPKGVSPSYDVPSYNTSPTVIHTSSGSNDMLTGVLVGNMLADHGNHGHYAPAPTPSYSAPASDSGFSWSSSDSGSSSWGDSGGGLSCSFGD